MGFNIQMSGAANWAPFEGGGDLYPFEGKTFGSIANVTPDKSEKGNDQLVIDLICDEEEGKGLKARKWVPVSGVRTDGKPNVVALYELLAAIKTMEGKASDVAIAEVRGMEGRALDSDQLIAALKGKKVCYEVEARFYAKTDGTQVLSSQVKNFILKSSYDDNKALVTHHRPVDEAAVRARSGGASQPPQGGGAQTPNLGGGQPLQGSVLGGAQNGATSQPAATPAAPTGGALGIL